MPSGSSTKKNNASNQAKIAALREADKKAASKRRRIRLVIYAAVVVIVAGVVTWAIATSGSKTSSNVTKAPDFTLTDSNGGSFTLSKELAAGHPVLLYFSEGAGCQPCITQQDQIESNPGFKAAGIVEEPIIMNSAEEIKQAKAAQGSTGTQPYLIDSTGKVTTEYGKMGGDTILHLSGMHSDLPGHGFVLVNAKGDEVWRGEYPNMWIDPGQLLSIVKSKLK